MQYYTYSYAKKLKNSDSDLKATASYILHLYPPGIFSWPELRQRDSRILKSNKYKRHISIVGLSEEAGCILLLLFLVLILSTDRANN
jgi:hypothetical protein